MIDPAINQVQLVQRQKELLEDLFGPEWFSQKARPLHPAYRRWALCGTIAEQGGVIKYPEQKEYLADIARVILDTGVLIDVTTGDPSQLRLGSLATYGDAAVQKKIRSRIGNPNQFEDLMVELYFGAWHKGKEGHIVMPLEQETFPDLKIETPDIDLPVFVECKRLRSVSVNRMRDVVKTASRQLGNTPEDSHRLAVLDVSTAVDLVQSNGDDLQHDDPIPKAVSQTIECVRGTLRGGKNLGVDVALVVWDDCIVFGGPKKGGTLLFLRRRGSLLEHERARRRIPEPDKLFEGYTAVYLILWKPRDLSSKEGAS